MVPAVSTLRQTQSVYPFPLEKGKIYESDELSQPDGPSYVIWQKEKMLEMWLRSKPVDSELIHQEMILGEPDSIRGSLECDEEQVPPSCAMEGPHGREQQKTSRVWGPQSHHSREHSLPKQRAQRELWSQMRRSLGWHLDVSLVAPWAESSAKSTQTLQAQKRWDNRFMVF